MLSFLKPKAKSHTVPADKIMPTYKKIKIYFFPWGIPWIYGILYC